MFTLADHDEVRVETEIKRSRFIASLIRVDDVDEALAFLDTIRAEFPDARHHCWAYVLGDEPGQRQARSSDDGEPGGTAGVPMLQVLEGRDLTNVVAMVTRYFGGVKLGAGGLVRAYSGAVKSVVDAATLVPRIRRESFTLSVEHAEAGRIEAELRGRGVDVAGVEYGARAVLTLSSAEPDALAAMVAALTAGRGELIPAGYYWA